jgi:DNA-binding response OmpR family regulator
MNKNGRILVIDDDETVRRTLAFFLEREGYLVDKAGNRQEPTAKSYVNFYNLAISQKNFGSMNLGWSSGEGKRGFCRLREEVEVEDYC